MGVYHGIEEKISSYEYVLLGEFTGIIIKNRDGFYYEEFHVLEQYRGNSEEYVLIERYMLKGENGPLNDLPFKSREKYLILTNSFETLYFDKYYTQGPLFCPVERYEDSFMDVLGEWVSLDFRTKGTKENFKDYDSFLQYILQLIELHPFQGKPSYPNHIESDDIYEILSESSSIVKIKVLRDYKTSHSDYYGVYECEVLSIYKGDFDAQNNSLTYIKENGESGTWKIRGIQGRSPLIWLFRSDLSSDKDHEYIVCNNGPHLIARKGIVSNDYTEEEIIQMLTEIYGGVNMIDLTEQAGNE